jgi:hypothetical protein
VPRNASETKAIIAQVSKVVNTLYNALQSRAKLVIIDEDLIDLDSRAGVCIHAKAGQTMTRTIETVKRQILSTSRVLGANNRQLFETN